MMGELMCKQGRCCILCTGIRPLHVSGSRMVGSDWNQVKPQFSPFVPAPMIFTGP
ncbi:hypothetical protein ACRRTK_009447 [Alexandromys fortis]